MRVSLLRKDIKKIVDPIYNELGFNQFGEFGESVRVTENGDKYGILIDDVKQSQSFSISVSVYVNYRGIEGVFSSIENQLSYTLTNYLAAQSISFEGYNIENLKGIVSRLIYNDAISFFEEFGSIKAITTNLMSTDHRVWITSDKKTQFKVKLAAAVLGKNTELLRSVIEELNVFKEKPWAVVDKPYLERLCTCAESYM